jgi:ADP-heptose:LPS heptosyltransferase
MDKKKVLVIRLSSIGDILLTFHVLKAIRHTHPEADIHVLTKTENAFIFSGIDVPIVVHPLNQSLYKTARHLQKEHFTHVIDLHNNLRTRLLQFAMLRWEWSRFKKWNVRKWLLTQFKLNTLPQMHVVDR